MASLKSDFDCKSSQSNRIDINNAEGTSLGNQFIIKQRLKAGVFGVVYKVHDQKNNSDYAIKFEKTEIKHDSRSPNQQYQLQRSNLRREIQILQELQGIEGVPQIISYGKKQNHVFLIQTLFDSDLSQKMEKYKLKSLSVNSALELARQMLLILQRIHEKGFVHRDLKPDNIMIGRSIRIRNSQQLQQINNVTNQSITQQNLTSVNYLQSYSDVNSLVKFRDSSYIDLQTKQRAQSRGKTLTADQQKVISNRDTQIGEKIQVTEESIPQYRFSTQNDQIRKDQARNCTLYYHEYSEPTSIKLLVSQGSLTNQLQQQQSLNTLIDNNVYLIDFGISKKVISSSGQHISFQENKQFIGTLRYASLAAHYGYEIGRKDDLESLGYIIIYLMKGKLPWQGIERGNQMTKDQLKEQLKKIKSEIPLVELCSGLPQGVYEYMKYVQSQKFYDIPSYETCWKLLKIGINNPQSYNEQFIFNGWDWDNQKNLNNKAEMGSIKIGIQNSSPLVNQSGIQAINSLISNLNQAEQQKSEQKQKINLINNLKAMEWRKKVQTRRSKSLSIQSNEKNLEGNLENEQGLNTKNEFTNQVLNADTSKIDQDASFSMNRSSFINLSLLKATSSEFQASTDIPTQKKAPQKSFLGMPSKDLSPSIRGNSSRYTLQNQGSSLYCYQKSQNSFQNNISNFKDSYIDNSLDYDSQDEEYYNDNELILKIKSINATNPTPK